MRHLFLLPFLLFSFLIQAQQWAYRIGAWSNDAFNALVIDDTGNIYVTGEFGGTIVSGSHTLVSQGSLDMVVAKFSSTGALIWTRTFGGSGLDRGVDIALAPNGDLVVTGSYMGTATFGTNTFSSQNGSIDVVLIRMEPVNGNVLWARTGGGPLVDRPNSVSVAPDGSIAVTGEFRGAATFEAGTITSMIDPQTLEHSVDIFVLAYSGSGDALWVKHGAAEFADRGMAVTHDSGGNVYVTGQFSDTLTFDQVHTNAMYSAIFIVRFSPVGDEEWFRIIGGGNYNQVFDIITTPEDNLLLVGDIQGTVIVLDGQPDMFTAAEPRSSFLIEMDAQGTFIRETTWGSDHPVNTRSLSLQENEVIVLGRFQCQFTGFSAISGEGTWLATGDHDLYVARFEYDGFIFKDAQQFGGMKNKVPGGIAHDAGGSPIFCGSFDHVLVFPSLPGQFTTTPMDQWVGTPSVPAIFCSDEAYGSYAGLKGYSLMDAFIAKGFTEGRQPYDFFQREPGDCDRPQRDVIIRLQNSGEAGADSLLACHQAYLSVRTHTAFDPDTSNKHTAPHLEYAWNTGQTTSPILINTSGWYVVTVTSAAGCWESTDSLYVTIHPLPAKPLVSDDVIVNTAAISPANIQVCEPALPWLWVTDVQPGHSVTWSGSGQVVNNDSIQVQASGYHTVAVTSPIGCVSTNQLLVTIHPSGELPQLEAEYDIFFPQDTFGTDTVYLCANEMLQYSAQVQLTLDGNPISLPYGVIILRSCDQQNWSLMNTMTACSKPIGNEGWYAVSLDIMLTNAPCGNDTLYFSRTDSIYVVPYPVTYPEVLLDAPAYICPGDTVTVAIVECVNCDVITWSGPYTLSFSDSVWTASNGTISVLAQHVDENDCHTQVQTSALIQWNPKPLLDVIPIDGVICPDSSATIFSDKEGLSYQWYGPSGPISVDNDTIITSEPGLYHLEMVDSLFCLVVSDPMLLTDYATPYLNVLPDNMLCEPGETATIQVVTTSTSTFQWLAPLSGGSMQQTVSEPGLYSCSVTGCGITTTVSVEIHGNNAIAALTDPGPFTICPDESLTLMAVPGMALNYWLPGPVIGPEMVAHEAGTYQLVAVDDHGCLDSTNVLVEIIPWTQALLVNDTTICTGTPLLLQVPGSGDITWFADAALTTPVGTGNTLDLGQPEEDITFWVQQVENGCTSTAHMLNVFVLDPAGEGISAPDIACLGGSVTLSVDAGTGVIPIWTTPNGPFQGAELVLDPVGLGDEGSYSVLIDVGACAVTLMHELAVVIPMTLDLGPDTAVCPGDPITFTVPEGFSSALWQDGSTGGHFTAGTTVTVVLQAQDPQGCTVTDEVHVEVFQFDPPLEPISLTACAGDQVIITVNGSGELSYFETGGTPVVMSGNEIDLGIVMDDVHLWVTQFDAECAGDTVPISVLVLELPSAVSAAATDPICIGSPFSITLSGNNVTDAQWTTPNGPTSGAELYHAEAMSSHAGVYNFIPLNGGCAGMAGEVAIGVLEPIIPDLGPDTTFCIGSEYKIEVDPDYSAIEWTTGGIYYWIVVNEPGTYGVSALDPQGCPVYAEITLTGIPCDLMIPNVFTPNGDGVNDHWLLGPGPFAKAEMKLFDRWGDMVWEGDVTRVGFDGRHYRTREPLISGTYYFGLTLTNGHGEVQEKKGYIQVIN